VQVTRQLREASRALDIELLDHVMILGEAAADPTSLRFYSFRQAGILEGDAHINFRDIPPPPVDEHDKPARRQKRNCP